VVKGEETSRREESHGTRWLGELLLDAGRLTEAHRVAQRSINDLGERQWNLALLARAAAHQGKREEALRILHSIEGLDSPWPNYYQRAKVAAALGEHAEVAELLRKAIAARQITVPYAVHAVLAFRPFWDYRPFQQLMRPKG
jgi:tetratricopeptide (TPR) repeat protein